MKARYRMHLLLVAGLLAVMTSTAGAREWRLLGLDSLAVHSLVCAHGTQLLMAGTERGVWVYDGKWHEAYTGLPVTDLAVVRSDVVLATVGNGSRSDAVLLGRSILDGPPYFDFTRLTWLLEPGPLTVVVPAEQAPQVYVVSQATQLFRGPLDLGQQPSLTLREMRLPPGAFGVEDPRCTALHVFGPEGVCYAGGYDSGVLPGPASLLHEISADSMAAVRTMNVSALTELQASYTIEATQPRDTIVTVLAAGTVDSGVMIRDPLLLGVQPLGPLPMQRWAQIPAPGDQPVLALLPTPAPQDSSYQHLCLAVSSGVYEQCPPNATCTWAELGDIPTMPLSLSLYDTGILTAGTDKGGFAYVDVTSVTERTAPHTIRASVQAPARQMRDGWASRIDGRKVRVSRHMPAGVDLPLTERARRQRPPKSLLVAP